jgi:hypothetical protein
LTVTPVGKAFLDPNVAKAVPSLNLDVRNVSQKCVIGFVIDKQFIDAHGRTIMTGSASTIRHGKDGGFNCLAPAQVFHWPMRLPANALGQRPAYAFTVD